jgi:hypothetical protein
METVASLAASATTIAPLLMRQSSKKSLLGVTDGKFCGKLNILSLAKLGVDAISTFDDTKASSADKQSPTERLQRR